MEDRVNVLLATYNGSKFLCEQLESIDSQTWPVARITIRDDGSTDDTMSLVKAWVAGRSHLTLLYGPRLGVAKNFFALLANPNKDSDYFAFSDQDDVWLPDKIERAVTALRARSPEEPALYCSRVEYVDDKLQHLGYSRVPKSCGFANALVENIATGCTVVLNRCARDLICTRLPPIALMHDWWCYLVTSALGKIIYDEWSSVKYRQHRFNAVGAAPSEWGRVNRRITRFLKQDSDERLLSGQALEFKRSYGDLLSAQDRRILERFLAVRGSFGERISYNAAMDVWRQSWSDTMILRALILMGRV